jgi:hypothetical protein
MLQDKTSQQAWNKREKHKKESSSFEVIHNKINSIERDEVNAA